MKGQFVAILMLLCVSQLTLGDDLAKEKKAAIRKVEILANEIYKGYKKSCDVFHNRRSLLETIKSRQLDLGQSLLELSVYEANQTIVEGKQKARLLADSPKVYDCIKTKGENVLNRLQKAFTEGFAKSLNDLFWKAVDRRQFATDRYSDDWHDVKTRAWQLEDTAIEQINATNNKAYIASIVEGFERTSTEFAKVAASLESRYKTNEINFDRTLQNGPVKAFRQFTRRIVDELLDSVNKCYIVV